MERASLSRDINLEKEFEGMSIEEN